MTRHANAPRTTLLAAALVAGLALVALVPASMASAEPKTEDEKTLYFLGVAISQNLQSFMLTPAEQEQVLAGIRAGLTGEEIELDPATYGPKVQAMGTARQQQSVEKEKAASKDFLEQSAKASGAKEMPSGLIYTEMKAGEGSSPGPTDVVKVHYHGTLRDGTVFDSSVKRGAPAEFPLNRVIACWTEGVGMMKPGGKSKLVCPPDIAYGDRGTPNIQGGSVLIFEVELLEIVEQ